MATVTSTIKIGPADHGRLMTLEEFLEAEVEEGYRYELARGVLEVTHVPNDPHGFTVWAILRFIALYDASHPRVIGRAGGGSEFRFWLPGMISGRNPDVFVVLRGTPKDWREYWIVDPLAKTVTVLIRDGDSWVEQVYREDQQAVSLVLPGLAIRLPDLWPDVEDEQADLETPNGVS
jgi:Uma2 family endonuclease